MKRYPNLRAALTAVAAIVGAGFASGREVMTFFSRLGAASYVGVLTACASAGLLGAMIAHFAQKHCAKTFPDIYAAEMGRACGESVDALYGLMLLLTGAAMCAAGGELAALALPIRFARPLGVAATMLAALYTVRGGRRALAAFGAALVPVVAAFYAALLFDRRAVSGYETIAASGVVASVPIAAIMGGLYATFNLSMAGGALCLACEETISPRRVGVLIGALLLAMLLPANAALLRAGSAFRALALPSVVLASRWGVFGFYACVAVFAMAVLSTLGAVLAPLVRQIGALPFAGADRAALPIAAGLTTLMSVVGFAPLVDAGYPLLGWACAFILLALIAFL